MYCHVNKASHCFCLKTFLGSMYRSLDDATETQSLVRKMKLPPLTAFILAGGKSSRMGQDKALLQYQGHYLIEYPIRVLRQITQDVRIVGNEAKYSSFGLPVIPDRVESKGPLSGIYSALKISPSDYNLFLACDMPLMRAEFFLLLLERIQESDAAVMKLRDGSIEPLCSIYRSSCLSTIEHNLFLGKFKISDFFESAKVVFIGDKDLRRQGLSIKIFTNINTAQEFQKLVRQNRF